MTWNCLRGCSRVSEGCRHCYAEVIAARFSGPGQPYEELAKRVGGEARWTGGVNLVETILDAPFRLRTPKRIFVNSMSDLFHEAVPDDWLTAIFGVMLCARRQTFQVLTKRPERMLRWVSGWTAGTDAYMRLLKEFANSTIRRGMALPGNLAAALLPGRIEWPLPNVWLGVSVEDQETADERIPLLLETPAAMRWISYEPALGPVELSSSMLKGLQWVVIGGESGPKARRFDLAWARSMIAQCRAANVPVFVKQLGANPVASVDDVFEDWKTGRPFHPRLRDRAGGDPAEWPDDLRVRAFPAPEINA